LKEGENDSLNGSKLYGSKTLKMRIKQCERDRWRDLKEIWREERNDLKRIGPRKMVELFDPVMYMAQRDR
jgi:hypothetical protein